MTKQLQLRGPGSLGLCHHAQARVLNVQRALNPKPLLVYGVKFVKYARLQELLGLLSTVSTLSDTDLRSLVVLIVRLTECSLQLSRRV